MPTTSEFWFVAEQVARERGFLVVGFSSDSDQPEIGSSLDNVLGFETKQPLKIVEKADWTDWKEQVDAFYRLRPGWGRGKDGDPEGNYYRIHLQDSTSQAGNLLFGSLGLIPPATANSLSFGGYAVPSFGILGASLAPRAAARVIDLVLHYFVAFIAGYLFRTMLIIAAGGRPPLWVLFRFSHSRLLFGIASIAGHFFYHVACSIVHGSSLGKMTLGLQVVQQDGSPCRLRSALIRELGFLVDSLFFGLIGYGAMRGNDQNQRLGDEWADTLVCKRRDVPLNSRHSGSRFLLGLSLGVLFDIVVIMTALLGRLLI